METITIPSKNLPKRKIWEIDNCCKCALIGTCINRTELRKLGREKIYQTPPHLDDYQLHVHFIRLSEHNDAAGKALHKFLEKKIPQRDQEVRSSRKRSRACHDMGAGSA